MTGFAPLKMKRKDYGEIYDDFSDFSLSSPARKIRRLDADLPPIIEEEEPAGVPLEVDPPLQPDGVLETEPVAVPSVPVNEERALVLYKPVNSPFSVSPTTTDFSLTVNTHLIPGFNKNQAFWPDHTNLIKQKEDEDSTDRSYGNNVCLAVVPWVSQQFPSAAQMGLPLTELSEPMQSEDIEDGTMEIEVEGNSEQQARETIGLREGDGFHGWQQQHCLTPQVPQNTATPVTWSW